VTDKTNFKELNLLGGELGSFISPTMRRHKPNLEDIEIQLLLEGMYLYYGYDFRNYAVSSLKRRIHNFLDSEALTTISALQEQMLRDRNCLERFLLA
jgi:chemotaxis protein methyltransferase CheR